MTRRPRVLVIGDPAELRAADATCEYVIFSDAMPTESRWHGTLKDFQAVVDLTGVSTSTADVERERRRRCEAGGFPIILVTNTPAARPHTPGFGSVNVIAMPSGNSPAVAAVCSKAAADYAKRQEISSARLRLLLAGFSLAFILIACFAITISFGSPLEEFRLKRRVVALRRNELPPEVRFAKDAYAGYIRDLQEIATSPKFPALSVKDREFVQSRIAEADAYGAFTRRLASLVLGPDRVRTEAELGVLELELDGPLAPPEDYAESWSRTPSGVQHHTLKEAAATLRRNRDGAAEWYRERIRRANELLLAAALDESAASALLTGEPTTEDPSVLEQDLVAKARGDWFATALKLQCVRDLGNALSRFDTLMPDFFP